jgi:hypothetical protein
MQIEFRRLVPHKIFFLSNWLDNDDEDGENLNVDVA